MAEIEPRIPSLSCQCSTTTGQSPALQSGTDHTEYFSHTLNSCVISTLIGVDLLSCFVVSDPDPKPIQSKHGSFSAFHLHVILKVPDEVWARDYLLCKPVYLRILETWCTTKQLTIIWGSGGSNSKHNPPSQSIYNENIGNCCQTLVEPPVVSKTSSLTAASRITTASGITTASSFTTVSASITALLIPFCCSERVDVYCYYYPPTPYTL